MFFLKSKRGLMDPIKTEHWLSSSKPVRDSNTCVWMRWILNHYILKRRQYVIFSTVNWIGQDWPCSHIRMVIVKSSWILKLFSFPVISSSSHPSRMSNDLTRWICKKISIRETSVNQRIRWSHFYELVLFCTQSTK